MPHQTEPSPEERLRAAYETAESRTAKAFEDAVSTASFGALLARSAENVAALTRLGSDVADLVLRNLRLAGRADVTRLARQLHRTEDKLERVLQEVEALRDELARREAAGDRSEPADAGGTTARARAARSSPSGRSGNGARTTTPRRRTAK